MAGFCSEESVCYTEMVVGAKLEKSLSIFVELPYSKVTDAAWPRVVVRSYASVEVT